MFGSEDTLLSDLLIKILRLINGLLEPSKGISVWWFYPLVAGRTHCEL